tara:strand:+ start:180 stop:377 length:198 start_codon:yes stop_codon:yes gene_type:complete
MTPVEFNKQYLCNFKPEPVIDQCVSFLSHATESQIREFKREGIFSTHTIREAMRIIEIEESKGAS